MTFKIKTQDETKAIHIEDYLKSQDKLAKPSIYKKHVYTVHTTDKQAAVEAIEDFYKHILN